MGTAALGCPSGRRPDSCTSSATAGIRRIELRSTGDSRGRLSPHQHFSLQRSIVRSGGRSRDWSGAVRPIITASQPVCVTMAHGVFGGADVAVADHRNLHGVFNGGDPVPIGPGRCSPARGCGRAGRRPRVRNLRPCGASSTQTISSSFHPARNFTVNGNRHGGADGFENLADQRAGRAAGRSLRCTSRLFSRDSRS